MNFSALIKRPSAFLPVAMSLVALSLVFGHILIAGTAPQADEGTTAHLWQLLMTVQIPIIMFFAVRWLPQTPKSALPILALQAVGAITALAPVFILGW